MKLINIIIVISILMFQGYCFAQQQQQQESAPPLELPNFIIEGKEQLNVQAGIKQYPEKPLPLKKSELDSINSLEKQQSLLLPSKPLPDKILYYDYKRGYLKGEFGRYLTPSFEAGYDFNSKDFELFGNAAYEYSDGHVKNADYSKGSIKLILDYIADDKYWIFGGSKTESLLSFKANNYKLYSIENPANRSVYNFNATIHSDGKHEGYEFSTGAGFKAVQLIQEKSDAYDNAINGYLTIRGLWKGFQAIANALVDFHSYSEKSTHFIQADASLKYYTELYTIDASLGLQHIENSSNVQRMALFLAANLDYRINKLFTLKALVKSGLNNNCFREMLRINPYLYSWSPIDFEYSQGLKALLYFHPNDKIAFSGGISIYDNDRTPYFNTKSKGLFTINYIRTQKFSIIAEGDWQITNEDNIIANLIINKSTMINSSNTLPYTEPLKLSLIYGKKWIDNLGTQIGLYYIGERYSDTENKNKLDGYLNLFLNADYKISNILSAFVKFENIFNADIYIYEGYKERGMFISAGVMCQF